MSCCSNCLTLSSSSVIYDALRSRNALWAARFCALRLVGGGVVIGFRPGFGRAGRTHSFEAETKTSSDFIAGEAAIVGAAAAILGGLLTDMMYRVEISAAVVAANRLCTRSNGRFKSI